VQDVTQLLNAYREAARLIWNNFLRDPDESAHGLNADNERYCDYNGLTKILFGSLVLRPLGRADFLDSYWDRDHLFFSWFELVPFLRVVPRSECPAMITRVPAQAGTTYWDAPVTRIVPDADLRYVECFDFDQMGYRDLQYYRVRIQAFPGHQELLGHDALVEVQDARVFHLGDDEPGR
jgi:hypothetical protein